MNASKNTARIAGVLYLIIIVSGIFAEFVVRQSLVVPGDAIATAANIVASEGLFRLGIAGDLIMIMSDIALALVFYVLLKPVSHALSLLAAFFRLVQATILGINLLNLFFVLQLLSGAEMFATFSADQLASLASMFLAGHGIGYSIGLIFFGLSLFVLGFLVVKSGYLPKILGALLIVAGVGYLIDSFASLLLPNYGDFETIFAVVVFLPAFIGELSMALWLLFKGIDTRALEARTLKPAAA
jgi:hypothetical protein